MKTLNYVRALVCFSILFTLFSQPSPVKACSCMANVSIQDNFAMYDAAFTGKVVRIIDNYTPVYSTIDYIMHKFGYPGYFFNQFVHKDTRKLGYDIFFKVVNSWKGVKTSYVQINTGRGSGDCGYSFEINEEYLLYASHAYGIPDNYWITGICSRNSVISSATEDLNYLNTFSSIELKPVLPILWAERDTFLSALILAVVATGIFIKQRPWKKSLQ